MIHNNYSISWLYSDDGSFKFMLYHIFMLGYWTSMDLTSNGQSGLDYVEGACEMANTYK